MIAILALPWLFACSGTEPAPKPGPSPKADKLETKQSIEKTPNVTPPAVKATAPCRQITFEAAPITACQFARTADIRLFLDDDLDRPIGRLAKIHDQVEPGERLVMAMNAGMYHADRRPVGLFVEEGEARSPLVTRAGPGNFGLLPNGVAWSDGARVHVTESLAYDALDAPAVWATQSGPMLVIDGELHPRFQPDSESRKIRNGIGVSTDHVVFAISDAPINFHRFARFFRDEMGARSALYLDGTISQLHAPMIGRRDRGVELGPILAVVEPR